jgi:hypothetical protein
MIFDATGLEKKNVELYHGDSFGVSAVRSRGKGFF